MVLLRLLRHPYIVAYKDFWRDGLTVYIVMEFCEGGDMAQLIDKGKSLSEEVGHLFSVSLSSCKVLE